MATLLDINALTVLVEWALDKGYSAPIYNPTDNDVTIAGIDDSEIETLLATITNNDITQSQARIDIRTLQMLNPRPKAANLEESKRWALMIAKQVIEKLRDAATNGADAATLTGWVDKLSLAQKIIDNTATADEIAIIQAEADMRGLSETAAALSTSIVAKGTLLRTVRSQIDGFEDRIQRELNAITDVPGYEAVVAALVIDGSAIISQLGV